MNNRMISRTESHRQTNLLQQHKQQPQQQQQQPRQRVVGQPPRDELYRVSRRRIVGSVLDNEELLEHEERVPSDEGKVGFTLTLEIHYNNN